MGNGTRAWIALATGTLIACGGGGDSGSGPGGGSSGSGSSSGGSSGASSSSGASGDVTCGGGGGPTGGPADLFPCDSVWYKDVSKEPVAAESDAIIKAFSFGNGNTIQIDFSIVYMHAASGAPTATFKLTYPTESDKLPVPIPPGGALEGEDGYSCTGGGDCHLIVVDDVQKKLFEVYAANDASGSWKGDAEAVWDLTKHYGPDERGLGCTSADAAGLPVMAGLLGVREVRAGAVKHALRFILPNPQIRSGPSYVAPASHGTSATSSDSGPPYGTRLRLKPSAIAKATTQGAKVVAQGLATYGMILADGGNDALTAEDDRFEKAKDPTMTWDGLLARGDLSALKPSDFEVVDFGAVQTGDDCTLNQ